MIKPTQTVNDYLAAKQTNPIQNGVFLDQLLKRAELNYEMVNILSPSPISISNVQPSRLRLR